MTAVKLYFSIIFCGFFVTFSGASAASSCFEKSPYSSEGGDIYLDHKIPKLGKNDYSNIQAVLKAAKGEWKGNMSVSECLGTRSSITIKSESYEVQGSAEFDGREFHFNMELYSPDAKTRKTNDLNYILTDDNFSINPRKSGKAEVLGTTPSGIRYYKRFRQQKVGQSGTFVNESYYVFEVYEDRAVLKENQYFNGEMVLESFTELVRN